MTNCKVKKEFVKTSPFTAIVSCGDTLFPPVGNLGESFVCFGIQAAGVTVGTRMNPERTDADYRVEVSGWDVAESFFVEKVTLKITELGKRVVHLKHPIRAGSIVFLRLMESRISFPALPVAYRVTEVAPGEQNEMNRVSLQKLRHRQTSEGERSEAIEPL